MSTQPNHPVPAGHVATSRGNSSSFEGPLPLASPAARNSARSAFPEISGLIVAASQHLALVLILAVAFAGGLAAVATMVVNEQFLATSFVQVRQREDYLLFNDQSRAEDAAVVRAQEELVVQQQNLAKALKSDEVQAISNRLPEGSRIEWLRGLSTVDLQPGAEVMSVTVTHESADVAQTLANAVTKVYLDDVSSRIREDRDRRRRELESAAQVIDERLARQWERLQKLAGDLGTGSPQTLSLREQIQMQGYREYAQQLRAAQLLRNQLETQLAEEQLQQQHGISVSETEIQAAIASHPEVVLQRGRLDFIEAKMHEISELVPRADSPRIMSLREDRDFYAAQLKQLTAEMEPRLRERMKTEEAQRREATLAHLKQQISLKKDEEGFLREMLGQLEGNFGEANGGNGVQLEILRHEIDRQEKLADSIWHSLEKIRIEEQARSRVELIEWAVLPDKANRGKQLKAAATAAVSGIFLAVFGVGYVEWKMCRIRHPKDVSNFTSLAVFGTGSYTDGLPLLWRLKNARHDPLHSGVNEVAAQLMIQTPGSGTLPSVLVTSATHFEPRHIVAAELAQAISRTGRRVLLIDCDASRPELTRRLGAAKRPGLCQWSMANRDLLGNAVTTSQEDLDFLPIGQFDESSLLLIARALPDAIHQARSQYDCLVVCGPAVLTTAESVLLASQLDNTLFTFVMGKSRWNLLAAAHHRLDFARVPVLGAVIHSARRIKALKSQDITPARRPGTTTPSDDELEERLQNAIKVLHAEINSLKQSSPDKDPRAQSPNKPAQQPES